MLHHRSITLFTSYSLIYGFEYTNTLILTVKPHSPSSETPSHTNPPHGGSCIQTPVLEPRAGPYAERDLPTTCPQPLPQEGKTWHPRASQRQNRTLPSASPTSGLWDHPLKVAGTTSAGHARVQENRARPARRWAEPGSGAQPA